MKHHELVERAEQWLRNSKRCRITAKELVAGDAQEIPDAVGWTYRGESILVECKTSLSDFQHDKHKVSRQLTEISIGRHRYYFVTKDLADKISDDSIPEGWGLAVVYPQQVRIRKDAPLHTLSPEGHRREKVMLGSGARRALLAVSEKYGYKAASLVKPFTVTDTEEDIDP